jgi:sortase A
MRKIGIVCVILGAALLGAALLLLHMNQQEDQSAQGAAVTVLPQLVQQVQEKTALEPEITDDDLLIPVELLTPEQLEMTEVIIDGHAYIGYLSIPKLELELPILSQWSYPKLQIAPCRYFGSLRGEDLVLVAHNYNSHFGRISQLEILDELAFTDMDGNVTAYQVVGKDILDPTAVEEMTSGDFDLTLFTCTYGGRSRVTIYCDRLI